MADFTVANPITTLNNLVSKLGLDKWQLQEGIYHDLTFHTVVGITETILNNLSPVNVVAGVSAVKSLFGQTGSNIFGKSDGIPFGTNTQLLSNSNISKKKYVINQLPNGRDNIQYLGFEGDTFNFDVIIWGISYDSIVSQIQKTYTGDYDWIQKPTFRVLFHPIYGQVNNCHFLEYQVSYFSERWRCAIVNLHFHSEQPVRSINKPNSLSTLANISLIIQSILALINVLNNGWLESSLFFSSATNGGPGSSGGNSSGGVNAGVSGGGSREGSGNVTNTTALVNTQSSVQNSIGNSILTTKILVGSLLPNYTNTQLNAQQTTSKDANSFNYYINHYSPNDINNLLNLLSTSIFSTISSIQNLSGSQYYSSIVQFNSVLSNINQLALNLQNSYYGTITSYETPSDMSLYEVCVANSLDFETSLPKIIQLNKGLLYWITKVNKGLVISLPKLLVGV